MLVSIMEATYTSLEAQANNIVKGTVMVSGMRLLD